MAALVNECVSLPQKEPAEFGGLTTYPTLKSSVQFHFRLLMFIPHLLPSVHSPCLPNNTIMKIFNFQPPQSTITTSNLFQYCHITFYFEHQTCTRSHSLT